ncbi:MAG TPA: glycosyltransferase [Acidimicrobiales bacterium]|nr:glycosyltransferase [Acidimicrobiales bacterium]
MSEAGLPVELTIVIPSRNVESELPAQLESLAVQEADFRWEVVVSDNGSTDRTPEVALRFANRMEIRVVDASGEPGRAFACNEGARAARGGSICFLDADDEVASGYVEAMASALRVHQFVAARVDISLNNGWAALSRDPFQHDGLLDVFGYLPFGIGCTLGVRRDVFEAVGGFSGEIRFDEDVDFCWRVQQAGFPLVFVPDAVVRYRFRDDLWSLFTQTYNYGSGQVLLYRRHRALGMPPRTWPMLRRELSIRLRTLVAIRGKADLARWLHETGYLAGRAVGSLRWRTPYV